MRKDREPRAESQKKSWRPDWRDEKAYPNKDASLKRRAWEFLRRNCDYERDWNEVIQHVVFDADGTPSDRRYHGLQAKYQFIGPYFDPATDYDPVKMRDLQFRPHFPVFHTYTGEDVAELKQVDGNYYTCYRGVQPLHPEKASEMVFKFHLAFPIDMQLDFTAVLRLVNDVMRDYLLLLLFTGMRRSEALNLRWDTDVDLRDGVITLRNTKNGDSYVRQLLSLRRQLNKVIWVFLSRNGSGPISAAHKC